MDDFDSQVKAICQHTPKSMFDDWLLENGWMIDRGGWETVNDVVEEIDAANQSMKKITLM